MGKKSRAKREIRERVVADPSLLQKLKDAKIKRRARANRHVTSYEDKSATPFLTVNGWRWLTRGQRKVYEELVTRGVRNPGEVVGR